MSISVLFCFFECAFVIVSNFDVLSISVEEFSELLLVNIFFLHVDVVRHDDDVVFV